jgi:hypothetical protein
MADAPRFRRAAWPPGAESERNQALIVALALAIGAYVVAYPFTLVRYPPITDLPFHAAQTSILRHYLDPSFHFREQFTLHPLEVPYLSMYALGALFALVLPISAATKLMAVAMLALVPAGLAVLFHGMKKSPLWGLAGTGLTWCTVTQWGFLNFMGAIGLFAMSTGFALLVVREPTRVRRAGLALCLVAIFFTHVYRFPFAILGVLAAGALVYPATRRFSPLIGPLVPALSLFVLWLAVRPHGLGIGFGELGFHPERLSEIPRHLFGSYLPLDGAPPTAEGALERALAARLMAVVTFAVVAATALFVADGRARGRSREDVLWALGVTAIPVLFAAGLLLAYLTLPFEVGLWFYVYPREIVAAALFAVAVAPDLPRGPVQRLAFTVLIAAGVAPMGRFVAARFREFEAVTADFREIVRDVPRSPRLFYLVYWLGDSNKRVSPFLHLPAWLQAEKGGALGFHFIQWNHSPIRYREGSPGAPPPFAERFEWTPQYFRVMEHGPWFDTFLVRHRIDPHELFDEDQSIRLVSHRGTWWLYRRLGGTADSK